MMKKWRMLWFILKRTNADKLLYFQVLNVLAVAILLPFVEPDINTFADSLWYTFSACTTIGFGDIITQTLLGRLLTAYISLCTLLLLPVLSGVVVSYYLEIVHRREQESRTILFDKLEHLPELSPEELRALSERIKKIK